MEADRAGIIMLLGIGMFLGVLLTFGISVFIGLSEESTEEQVSIQEEEMECIGLYKMGAFLSVWKIHDNKDNVTCWIQGEKGGISCIPDHMLTP